MNAQYLLANRGGDNKWRSWLRAALTNAKLVKLLFNNQDKITQKTGLGIFKPLVMDRSGHVSSPNLPTKNDAPISICKKTSKDLENNQKFGIIIFKNQHPVSESSLLGSQLPLTPLLYPNVWDAEPKKTTHQTGYLPQW